MNKIKHAKNKRKSYFQFLLILFLLGLGFYGYLRVDNILIQKKISHQKELLNAQNKQLDLSKNKDDYEKLSAVRLLENKKSIPWSEHIPKIISMLEDLKAVDTSDSETIVLSDFKVNLDTISLKGKVSSLPLLYVNSQKRHYTSLLDKFSQLDFINNLRIQSYEREGSRNFEFVLDANVIIDDNTK